MASDTANGDGLSVDPNLLASKYLFFVFNFSLRSSHFSKFMVGIMVSKAISVFFYTIVLEHRRGTWKGDKIAD